MTKIKIYLSDSQFLSIVQRLFVMLCISFTFIISGCGDSSTDPDLDSNGNSGDGGVIGSSPTFDNIGKLFLSHCGNCHTSQQVNGVRLNTYTNAIQSVGDKYQKLVIQPGDAAGSPLVDKIESNSPQIGDRMPQGRPALPVSRINQIKAWIDNGALNDTESESESE